MRKLRKVPFVRVSNQTRQTIVSSKIKRLTHKILARLRRNVILDLVFVSDSQIRSINKLFHGQNQATDVLAFSKPPRWPAQVRTPAYLGEVIISLDHVRANARRYHVSQDEELARYMIHGILHLVGERDDKPIAREEMLNKQEKILNAFYPISNLLI